MRETSGGEVWALLWPTGPILAPKGSTRPVRPEWPELCAGTVRAEEHQA